MLFTVCYLLFVATSESSLLNLFILSLFAPVFHLNNFQTNENVAYLLLLPPCKNNKAATVGVDLNSSTTCKRIRVNRWKWKKLQKIKRMTRWKAKRQRRERERERRRNGSKRELSTGLGARRLPVYCVAQSVIFTNDHHRLLSSSVIIASLG